MLTLSGMPTPPHDAASDTAATLLYRLGVELQRLAGQVSALAAELHARHDVSGLPRPWWDEPVHGLPLEEALKGHVEEGHD